MGSLFGTSLIFSRRVVNLYQVRKWSLFSIQPRKSRFKKVFSRNGSLLKIPQTPFSLQWKLIIKINLQVICINCKRQLPWKVKKLQNCFLWTLQTKWTRKSTILPFCSITHFKLANKCAMKFDKDCFSWFR